MENEIFESSEAIEADLISIQDSFEADVILFSELDSQAQNEVEALADFGYTTLAR